MAVTAWASVATLLLLLARAGASAAPADAGEATLRFSFSASPDAACAHDPVLIQWNVSVSRKGFHFGLEALQDASVEAVDSRDRVRWSEELLRMPHVLDLAGATGGGPLISHRKPVGTDSDRVPAWRPVPALASGHPSCPLTSAASTACPPPSLTMIHSHCVELNAPGRARWRAELRPPREPTWMCNISLQLDSDAAPIDMSSMGAVDAVFEFPTRLGAAYRGRWASPRVAELVVLDPVPTPLPHALAGTRIRAIPLWMRLAGAGVTPPGPLHHSPGDVPWYARLAPVEATGSPRRRVCAVKGRCGPEVGGEPASPGPASAVSPPRKSLAPAPLLPALPPVCSPEEASKDLPADSEPVKAPPLGAALAQPLVSAAGAVYLRFPVAGAFTARFRLPGLGSSHTHAVAVSFSVAESCVASPESPPSHLPTLPVLLLPHPVDGPDGSKPMRPRARLLLHYLGAVDTRYSSPLRIPDATVPGHGVFSPWSLTFWAAGVPEWCSAATPGVPLALVHKGSGSQHRTPSLWVDSTRESVFPRVSTRQSEDDGPTLALRLACGEWTHFGLTFEPTASAGDAQAVPMVITLYVNGSVLAAFSAQNVAANRGALHVGSDGSNGPWPGLVAGVALWEGAVAPEEAQRMGSLPPASAPATSPSAPDLALDGDFVDPAAGSGGVQGQASSDDHAGEVCTSPQACHALAALAGMLGVQPPVAAGEEAGQQLAFATAVRAFLSCGPRLDSLAPGVQSVLAGASAVAARHISSSPSAHTAAQSLLAEADEVLRRCDDGGEGVEAAVLSPLAAAALLGDGEASFLVGSLLLRGVQCEAAGESTLEKEEEEEEEGSEGEAAESGEAAVEGKEKEELADSGNAVMESEAGGDAVAPEEEEEVGVAAIRDAPASHRARRADLGLASRPTLRLRDVAAARWFLSRAVAAGVREAAWPLGVLESRGLGSFHALDALRSARAAAAGGAERLSLWQRAPESITEPLPPLVLAALQKEHAACRDALDSLEEVHVPTAAEWRRVERARAPARYMLAASGALPYAEPGGAGHWAALRAGVDVPSPSWAAGQAHLALALAWLHGDGGQASARQAAYHAADAAVASGVHYHLRGHQPLNEHKLVVVEAHREAAVEQGERGEDDERIQHRLHQAAGGDVEAQLDAGTAYYYGVRGLPRDQVRARDLFEQAAAAGSPPGQAAFADMLIKGEGGPVNATAAVELYERAAEHDLVRALNGLGYAYLLGQGTAPNVTRARELFDRAAALGREPDSMFNAAILHLEGRGGPANLTRAHELFEAAADAFNHFGAKEQLGAMALRGEGPPTSLHRAVDLLVDVAQRGPWGESTRLAFNAFLEGDTVSAVAHYAEGAACGLPSAAANLAHLLLRDTALAAPLTAADAQNIAVAARACAPSPPSSSVASWLRKASGPLHPRSAAASWYAGAEALSAARQALRETWHGHSPRGAGIVAVQAARLAARGVGVWPPSCTQADRWLEAAAGLGSAEATFTLALRALAREQREAALRLAARTRVLARAADDEDGVWHDPALGPAAAGWSVGAVIWLAQQSWVPALVPRVLAAWLVRDAELDYPACAAASGPAGAVEDGSKESVTAPSVWVGLAAVLMVGGAALLWWGTHRNRRAWASLQDRAAALQEQEAQMLRWQVYLATQWEAVRSAAEFGTSPNGEEREAADDG